ncbi:MAG: hypothetical protein ABIJ12_00855 [bacterium]
MSTNGSGLDKLEMNFYFTSDGCNFSGNGRFEPPFNTTELAGVEHCALISRQRKTIQSGKIISSDIFGFIDTILK